MQEDEHTSQTPSHSKSSDEGDGDVASGSQFEPPADMADGGKDDSAHGHPRSKMYKVTSSTPTSVTLQSTQSLCTLNNAFREAESAVPGFKELELIGHYFTLPYRSGLNIENLKILTMRGKKGNLFSLLRSLANACPMLTNLELDFPDEELVDIEESPTTRCDTLQVFKLTVDQLEDFRALLNAVTIMYPNLRQLTVKVVDEYEWEEDEETAKDYQVHLNLDGLDFAASDMDPDDQQFLERTVLSYCPHLTVAKVEDGAYYFRRSLRISGYFGHLGGELTVATYDVKLSIPAGALEEGSTEKISLELFSDLPNGISLQENEVVASLGFRCFPSGLTFKKPITLALPHCALLEDANNIKTILHFGKENAGTHDIKRIDLDSEEYTLCDGRIELYLGHFSWGITTLIYNWLFPGEKLNERQAEKRMLCTPFLPTKFPGKIGCPILHLCIYNQLAGLSEDLIKEENSLDYEKAYPEQELLVKATSTNMSIICETICSQESTSESMEEISTTDLMQHTKLTVPITLSKLRSMVTLIIKQERKITMKFPADIKGADVEAVSANLESLALEDASSRSDAGASASDGILVPCSSRNPGYLSDEQLVDLLRELPPDKFVSISVKLGFTLTETEHMRSSSNNTETPYTTMLTRWKSRSGAPIEQLLDALKSAKLFAVIQNLRLGQAKD